MNIENPWGHEEVLFSGERYVLKKLFMKAGHRCSLQYHDVKMETVYMLEGELELLHGPTENSLTKRNLKAGDFFTINPGEVHRMSAVTDACYLEASTPELNDVVRLKDDY